MIGRVLLHYRILHPLGAGGMGEVYAAEDTRLNRRVALKLLPSDTADDPVRLQRFRREAQAIASLNHPNVVTIYAVEDCDGVTFLTMEIVEGQTIDALIPPTGVEWRNFFKWAIPLVEAIAAAHQQHVVHRDIKPRNIMVSETGRLKVLDFGIAKVRPTIDQRGFAVTESVTGPHHVVGTTAYMSPEQAEGKQVDARSDIFSLGIVLYEMAAGTRPFKGDTDMSLLSSIIKDPTPPLVAARPDVPADLDRIIRRCLAKEPGRRYQTAIDLRNELEDLQHQTLTGATVAAPAPSRRPWITAAAAVMAIAVLGVAAAVVWRGAPSPPVSVTRATFSQQTSQPGIEWFPSLSPDGRWIVYAGDAAGNRDIYLQSVGGQTPINLTKDSLVDDDQPAFSPDGEQIVFRSARDGGGLFVMGRTGEAVRRITRAGFNPAWSPDGTQIAFTSFRLELRPQNTEGISELFVVSAEGGEARRLSEVDAALPSWSPSGRLIAFGSRRAQRGADRRIDIVTIAPDGGALVAVTEDAYIDWNPVWAPDGRHLYFVSDRGGSTNIWRVSVDQSTGRTQGEPEPITSPAPFASHLSISADGRRLAYSAVIETQNIVKLDLDPITRTVVGQPTAITTGSRFWANPDPSPDGASVVAYSQVNPEGDLYVFQADGSGAMRQLTSDEAIDRVPRWSPDGAWIAAFSDRDGSLEPWLIRPDGSDLHKNSKGPNAGIMAWSPDAKRIAFNRSGSLAAELKDQPNMGIMPADPASPDAAEVLIPGPPTDGRFVPNSWSHDGKWLVGQQWFGVLGVFRFSVHTRTFERLTDFGEWPVWLPDNRHVLFVSRGREFHILDTHTKTTTQIFSVLRDTLGPPRLTRDGRRAFFSRRITESDVWMVNLQ